MMRKLFDHGVALVLAGVLIAPGWAHAGPVVSADSAADAGPTVDADSTADAHSAADAAAPVVPMVKVEIKHRGRVLQAAPRRLDWDEAGAIRIERGDRVHDITIEVNRKGNEGKKLHVTLTYELDGERVIENFAYDTRARKREVLRTEGVALAVTITPRTLDDGGSTGRENKLDPSEDTDDPLAGL